MNAEKKILRFLEKVDKTDFWSLCKEIGYIPSVIKSIQKLEKNKLVEIKNSKILLTKKGKTI